MLTALALAILPAPQASPAVQVGFPPRWTAGERYVYEVVQTREERAGGRPAGSTESRWTIEAEVVGPDGDGFALRWVLRDFEIVRPERAPELLYRTASIAEGIELELGTSALGVPERVANLEAVQRGFLAIRAALDVPAAGSASAQERARIEQAAAAWADPELVQAGALVEPQKLFLAMGLSLEPGVPQGYREGRPNPFGGAPLPAECVFELASHDPEAERAEVSWSRKLDRAATERAIRAELTRLAAADGRPPPELAELPRFENSSEASWTMDTRRGWPRRMTWSTRVETDDFAREERWTYTLR